MRSTRGSSRGRSPKYFVSGASSDRTPFSHNFKTAYANTVLLTEPASKIVSSAIGAPVSTLATPYERRHASAASVTTAMDSPGTFVCASSSGIRLSRYAVMFRGSLDGEAESSFFRAHAPEGSRVIAQAARQVAVTNLRRLAAIAVFSIR